MALLPVPRTSIQLSQALGTGGGTEAAQAGAALLFLNSAVFTHKPTTVVYAFGHFQRGKMLLVLSIFPTCIGVSHGEVLLTPPH